MLRIHGKIFVCQAPLVNKDDMITSLKWVKNMAHKKECVGVFATHDPDVKEKIVIL